MLVETTAHENLNVCNKIRGLLDVLGLRILLSTVDKWMHIQMNEIPQAGER